LEWNSNHQTHLTVKQVEELSAEVAAAVINELNSLKLIEPKLTHIIICTHGSLCLDNVAYMKLKSLIPNHPAIIEYEEYIKEQIEMEVPDIFETVEEFYKESIFMPNVERTNPALLSLVDIIPNAKIITIPSTVDWYLYEEDNGTETIHEKHKTWR
jgi:hypothetical protein